MSDQAASETTPDQPQGMEDQPLSPQEKQVAITKKHVSTYADLVQYSGTTPNQRLLPARFYLASLYFMTVSTARLLGMDDVLDQFSKGRGHQIARYAATGEGMRKEKVGDEGEETPRIGGEGGEENGREVAEVWEQVIEGGEGAEEFRQWAEKVLKELSGEEGEAGAGQAPVAVPSTTENS